MVWCRWKCKANRGFDYGGYGVVQVETETKGNERSILTAILPPFFENVTYRKG